MRIVVLGDCPVGSVIGAKLAEAGHVVGLLVESSHLEYLQNLGVTIDEAGRSLVVRDMAFSDKLGTLAEALEGFELAIIATKAYETEAACRALLPFLEGSLSRVLLFQEGVGGDDLAIRVLGKDRLIAGTSTLTIVPRGIAHYEMGSVGGVILAPILAIPHLALPLVPLFAGTGLVTRSYLDCRAVRWSKLLLDMLGNAVPAILGISPKKVFADPSLYALEVSALREARKVMRARGIKAVSLPGYPMRRLAAFLDCVPIGPSRKLMASRVLRYRGPSKAPLEEALERGGRRLLEAAFVNGAIVREGTRCGVPTPVNEAIYEAFAQVLRGEARREEFLGLPEVLRTKARMKGWQGR